MGRPQTDPSSSPYPPQPQTNPPPQPQENFQPPPQPYTTPAYPPENLSTNPQPSPPPPQPVAFPPPNQQPALQAFPPPEGYAPQPAAYPARPFPPAPGCPMQMPVHLPPAMYGQRPATVPWSSDIFSCCDDPMNALITALFPCLTFAQIAEIVDEGRTTCTTSGIMYAGIACCIGLPCLLSCTYRTKLRAKYELVEAPAPDWVSHFLCEWCALCQEYRELKNRGFDPALGWHGNMALMQQQQQAQAAMKPPMNQTMYNN
ncbi:hypothetical protein AMTRI_Chr04g250590 [Amborella trichopoda]|uniref:Uncharacterized protein n=1 Tax=Amborella trichopoda TaxID=13333 RepID=W1NFR7_AMBTC|nr:protein PLANT CADMIUM RESISTANCE 4 [Amborella trichopoda]ERM94039.1 hypothetical protein AMTR_s00010p00032660 [Amborella trichopoda]|eukprot:XP_006826802.3 protein PLANT CADMIUM RESISTANCE 4 [Amborella trichopoda]